MSDKILAESLLEESEPITPDELIGHMLQDIVADNSPSEVAAEFIDDFVLQSWPETGQILSLLEMPTQSLIELLKGFVGQGYQSSLESLDSRGVKFLENLKTEVKRKMTQLARDES